MFIERNRRILSLLLCFIHLLLPLNVLAESEIIAVIEPETDVLLSPDGEPLSPSMLVKAPGGGSVSGPSFDGYNGSMDLVSLHDFSVELGAGTESEWQIAERPHQSSFDVSQDDCIAVSKSVAPTEIENEFIVTLDIRARLSWTYLMQYTTLIANLTGNTTTVHAQKHLAMKSVKPSAGDCHTLYVTFYSPDGTTELGRGTFYTTTEELKKNSMTDGQQTWYSYNEYLGGYLFSGKRENFTSTVKEHYLEFNLSKSVYDQYQLLTGVDAVAAGVTDSMGGMMVGGGEQIDVNLTSGGGIVQWEDPNTGKISYWRQSTATYPVTLDVKREGFVESASYATNGPTSVTYTDNNGETQTFAGVSIPKVSGMLYDIEITKVDDDSTATVLAGAVFELYSDDRQLYGSGGSYATDKDGKITIAGLPAGTYGLYEKEAPPYCKLPENEADRWTMISLSHSALQNSSFVCAQQIINHREPRGELTIEKVVSGSVPENQRFVFHVRLQNAATGDLISEQTVSLAGGERITISGIPAPFTYTVTEATEWSWRYEAVGSSSVSGRVEAFEEGLASFSNAFAENQWESDTGYTPNTFD